MILRYSGGHSAYCGTAPHVYDVKTDRYSIPFAPEIPLEYVGTNDQVGGEWSFQGNPWMTGHTYKSTGYDPWLRSLVFAAHDYTYFFDPQKGRWSRSRERNPHDGSCFTVTLCATPEGVICWAEKPDRTLGLWRLDALERKWVPLPVDGPLPAHRPDQHGMAFDSKRNRLLLFSAADENQGDVLAYDLATGKSAWLGAAGKNKAAVPKALSGYKEINLRALKLLSPGGILVTCSCSYNVSEAMFADVLAAAAVDAHADVVVVEKRMQGRDHPVLMTVPETYYLKCFVLRKL